MAYKPLIKKIARTQQPNNITQLDPTYPWDLLVVPSITSKNLVWDSNVWTAAGANGYTGQLGICSSGIGLATSTGVGGLLITSTASFSRKPVTGIVALYVAPSSSNGNINLSHSTATGEGTVGIVIGTELVIYAPNEYYQPAATLNTGFDPRGKVVCIAVSGGKGTSDSVIKISAAINGMYIGEATSTADGGGGIRGSSLSINNGNGYNGFTGTVLYAGYWEEENDRKSPTELVQLSKLWKIFTPSKRNIYIPPVPTLSNLVPTNTTHSSTIPSVTFS